MKEGSRNFSETDLKAYLPVILAMVMYPKFMISNIKPTLDKKEKDGLLALKNELINFLETQPGIMQVEIDGMREDTEYFERLMKAFTGQVIDYIHSQEKYILELMNNFSVNKERRVSLDKINEELCENPNKFKYIKNEEGLIPVYTREFSLREKKENLDQEDDEETSSIDESLGELEIIDLPDPDSQRFEDFPGSLVGSNQQVNDYDQKKNVKIEDSSLLDLDDKGVISNLIEQCEFFEFAAQDPSSLNLWLEKNPQYKNPINILNELMFQRLQSKEKFQEFIQAIRGGEKQLTVYLSYHKDLTSVFRSFLAPVIAAAQSWSEDRRESNVLESDSSSKNQHSQVAENEYQRLFQEKENVKKIKSILQDTLALLDSAEPNLGSVEEITVKIKEFEPLISKLNDEISKIIKESDDIDKLISETLKTKDTKLKDSPNDSQTLAKINVFLAQLRAKKEALSAREKSLKQQIDNLHLDKSLLERQRDRQKEGEVSAMPEPREIGEAKLNVTDVQLSKPESDNSDFIELAVTHMPDEGEFGSLDNSDLEERRIMVALYIDTLKSLQIRIDDQIPASIKGETLIDISFLQAASNEIRAKIKNAEDYQRYLMDNTQVSISEVHLNEIIREFDSRTQYIEGIKNKAGIVDGEDRAAKDVVRQSEPTVPEETSQEAADIDVLMQQVSSQSTQESIVLGVSEDELLFSGGDTTRINPDAPISDEQAANIEEAKQGMKRRPQSDRPTAQEMHQRFQEQQELQDAQAKTGIVGTLTLNEIMLLMNKYLSALEKLKVALLYNAQNAQDHNQKLESERFMDFHKTVLIRINHAETYFGCLEGRMKVDDVYFEDLTNEFYSMPNFIQDMNGWVGIVDIMNDAHDISSKHSNSQNQAQSIEHISEPGRVRWLLREQQLREERRFAKNAADMLEQEYLPTLTANQSYLPAPAVDIPPVTRGFNQSPVQEPVDWDFYNEVIQLAVGVGLYNPVRNQDNGITFIKPEALSSQSQPSQVCFQGTQKQWTVKGNHLSAMVALASEVASKDVSQSTVLTIESKDKSNPACIIQDLLALMQLTQKGIPVNTANLDYLYDLKLHSERTITSLQAAIQRHPNQYPPLRKGINTADDVTDLIDRSLREASVLHPERGGGFNYSSG